MGISASSSLGSFSSQFFSPFFFLLANMNLTVFAGILLAVTMATARRASLGEKTMQAAGEADEPAGAKRANEGCKPAETMCENDNECCSKDCFLISYGRWEGKICN